jgi:hypothetical protein
MVETDLSNVPEKKPKASVSLSLDKENIDFLKEDLERHSKETGKELTLSGVFDYWLEQFVAAIKEANEKKKHSKKEEVK